MSTDDSPGPLTPLSQTPGFLLGSHDVLISAKGGRSTTTRANFFYNHQLLNDVWIEIPVEADSWTSFSEVEVSSPGLLQPFPAMTRAIQLVTRNGQFAAVCLPLEPLRVPIDSVPVDQLAVVTFALLDGPFSRSIHENWKASLRCADFELTFTQTLPEHARVADVLGHSPHAMNCSGSLRKRNGERFSSAAALSALNVIHDTLSFAAGKWIGITLVEGNNDVGERVWFRLGTTKISDAGYTPGWFDSKQPEWLMNLCDALIEFKQDEQAADVINTALYWYTRSNTRGGGVDGALILTQCALELLSWFVIVRRERALSEAGYGQLWNAAERLRLMLSLLKIPSDLPAGLPALRSMREEWDDVADAVVEARNYLVHPTQSRSGKRRQKKELPWHELWVVGQWVLELVILRLLGYDGFYENRTRLGEAKRNEPVPWISSKRIG